MPQKTALAHTQQNSCDNYMAVIPSDLKGRAIETLTERNDLVRSIDRNMEPIPSVELAKWIGYLFAVYSNQTKNDPPDVRSANRTVFKTELADLPLFAVVRAINWWNSRNNPDVKWMPKAGEIGARAVIEMEELESARRMIRAYDRAKKLAEADAKTPKLVAPPAMHEMSLVEFDAMMAREEANRKGIKNGDLYAAVAAVYKTVRLKIVHREAAEQCENCEPARAMTRPRK